jgi:16S rRNA (adenine1518-N6/adenine1519-N6)-dimethyltransferase
MANKLLGQNFLRCSWVVDTLVRAAELKKSDTVLEIGPGTGILTKALAPKAGKVIAVEKDHNLVAHNLYRVAQTNPNVEIIEGDILKLLQKIILRYKLPDTGYKVVANIPYYLTSRLFRLLLENPNRPELIIMTIQKEVAQRIIAKPGQMNILAASVQIFGNPEIVKKVPRSCFSPVPRVDSAVIKISGMSDRKLREAGVSTKDFFNILKTCFSSPRKTLLNNLAKRWGREKAAKILDTAGINPSSRPQELGIEDILRLASTVKSHEV